MGAVKAEDKEKYYETSRTWEYDRMRAAIYIVGTIFFFQSPAIAAGISGGASSGGHGFLQTGANMLTNRLMFRRATQANRPSAGGGATGGSASRSN